MTMFVPRGRLGWVLAWGLVLCLQNGFAGEPPIDRKAWVTRHNVVLTSPQLNGPLSVGNGEFAFTADITGLQTFEWEYNQGIPLSTMSQWGFHAFPNPQGFTVEKYPRTMIETRGKPEPYLYYEEGKSPPAWRGCRQSPLQQSHPDAPGTFRPDPEAERRETGGPGGFGRNSPGTESLDRPDRQPLRIRRPRSSGADLLPSRAEPNRRAYLVRPDRLRSIGRGVVVSLRVRFLRRQWRRLGSSGGASHADGDGGTARGFHAYHGRRSLSCRDGLGGRGETSRNQPASLPAFGRSGTRSSGWRRNWNSPRPLRQRRCRPRCPAQRRRPRHRSPCGRISGAREG